MFWIVELNSKALNLIFLLTFSVLVHWWFVSCTVFPGFGKQASWEAHQSLAANRHWMHYTLWHKWLNESAHLLKGVFPPWCRDTISPYFVLNPNDWRRCASIMDYWGLNLIELKRSPVNHITLSFLFTARRQKPPLAVTWQDTKVGVPADCHIPQTGRWSNED